MSKRKPTMTDVLKTAIERSGKTRYQIAQDTGVLQTSLSRFMRGETSLRLDKADVLAEYLGLELVSRKSRGQSTVAARSKGDSQ
jgi:transcriptional regulator with XRE-family HTH domain